MPGATVPVGAVNSGKGPDGRLRVCVVGGSIAGCAAAIELQRAGCEVTIFERSAGSLKDRGAGIGIPFALLELLQARDLFDAEMAFVPIKLRDFFVRVRGEDRLLWKQGFVIAATSWDELYRNLRKRVDDDVYRQGCEVAAIETESGGALVELAGGQRRVFDLVVCADGYTSTGRRRLFAGEDLRYAGYVMWRGMLDEGLLSSVEPYEGINIFAMSRLGHLIAYLVPGKQGETGPGERRLNWGWYLNTPQAELGAALTDHNGRRHATSLPAGSISEARVGRLRELARDFMPGFVSEAVALTEQPFIQAIFDLHTPNYRKGNIVLLGDASSVARPHAAAGATKALYGAVALAQALKRQPSLERALTLWNEEQSREGERLVSLSKRLGEALQDPMQEWADMGEEEMSLWWKGVIGDEEWYVMTDDS